MIIGAHLSIAKGMPRGVQSAADIGANALQFFTRNPRGGRARDISHGEIEAFLRLRVDLGIEYTLGHMPYTINLATNRPNIYEFSKMILLDDLKRLDKAKIHHLVLHPGSHLGDGVQAGIRRVVAALDYVFERYNGDTVLLLETMSGHGTELGANLDEMQQIFEDLGWPKGLGLGLDCCHLFAAGYDVASHEGLQRLGEAIDGKIGFGRVGVMHLNDSKGALGSGIDRHARIGQGMIGLEGIAAIVNSPVFRNLPFILETPVDDYLEYGQEIEIIMELRQDGRKEDG